VKGSIANAAIAARAILEAVGRFMTVMILKNNEGEVMELIVEI
jgi:hypothetical protein